MNMNVKVLLLLILCIALGTKKANSSYLDVPRLHFNGKFRADSNSRNNKNCNFDVKNKLHPPDEWNVAGTQEFEFIDTKITSVIDKNGHEDTTSELLGAEIFSNDNQPFAKNIALDVDFKVSTLFGLRFGLKHNGTEMFVGNWIPCAFIHDLWSKVKCTRLRSSTLFSTQSTTKIVDVVWSNSTLISEFKSEIQKSSNELQVSITFDCYNCEVFTIGRVYGTIGKTSSSEPLCVGGERKMEPVYPQPPLTFDTNNPCSDYSQQEQMPWMYSAPFKHDLNRKVIVADLSNALPMHFTSIDHQRVIAPIDLGNLYFGYKVNSHPYSVDYRQLIYSVGKGIPYLKSDTWKRSGVIELSVEDQIHFIKEFKLVLFNINHDHEYHPYCCRSVLVPFIALKYNCTGAFSYLNSTCFKTNLLLEETEFFIRPMGIYIARVENTSQLLHPQTSFITDKHEFTLLVTKFGRPVNDTSVTVIKSYNDFGDETHMQLPDDGVKYDDRTKSTNEMGHVTFRFTLAKPIPPKRHYSLNPNCIRKSTPGTNKNEDICDNPNYTDNFKHSVTNTNMCYELPIDGQVYNFYYCVGKTCELPKNRLFLYKALMSILAFSNVNYDSSHDPTWVDDVKDYFEQQHHLFVAMRSVLNLGNFADVTLPRNIKLLQYVLSKDSKESFDKDPNYMPTTRNLSPAKRNLILKWLNGSHCYKRTSCNKADTNNKNMPVFERCLRNAISFKSDPQDQDDHFHNMIAEDNMNSLINDIDFPPRLLFGLQVVEEKENYPTLNTIFANKSFHPQCNVARLQTQLQQAVQLEFYTIPLYLTALYSIIENQNIDTYSAIRDVVMQEMLHMVQAANILIAIGGKVMIDDPEFAPSYPAKGLPGGVLHNLNIHLQKYSLLHVHNTLMGIELPIPHQHNHGDSSILYTIGMFYSEIKKCIKKLGNKIFKPHENFQVKWPFDGPGQRIGTVHLIRDKETARNGINEITKQKGAGYLEPNQIKSGLYAHFYQFEELVCQKRLVKFNKTHYAFKGDAIIYDKSGVYPMIDDPNKDSFESHTHCYTQARAFHRVYRMLLRVLQRTFNGEPEKITEAVELMKSLQVHAKRCISTPYSTHDYNCGPVWDYEWE